MVCSCRAAISISSTHPHRHMLTHQSTPEEPVPCLLLIIPGSVGCLFQQNSSLTRKARLEALSHTEQCFSPENSMKKCGLSWVKEKPLLFDQHSDTATSQEREHKHTTVCSSLTLPQFGQRKACCTAFSFFSLATVTSRKRSSRLTEVCCQPSFHRAV